jgi:hypothetical protein
VQVRNSSGLGGDGALVVVDGVIVRDGLATEPLVDGGRLRYQGVGLRTLVGQGVGVGGGADALLGSDNRLEEVRLLSKLVHAGHDGLVLESVGGCVGVVAQLGRGGGGRRAG